MTTTPSTTKTHTPPSTSGVADTPVGRAAASPAGTSAAGPVKLRRRPMVAIAAIALVLLGGMVGVWAWLSGTTSVEVVATRAAVERGATIAAEDLMVVRVNPDPALRTVTADRLGSLAGLRATTDLVAGTLVAPEQVSDVLPPAEGLAVVGIASGIGLLPAEPLRPGDHVRLVQTPGAQGEYTDAPVALAAEVLTVRLVEERTVVDVLVPAGLAPEVAARAATGKVALVLDARER